MEEKRKKFLDKMNRIYRIRKRGRGLDRMNRMGRRVHATSAKGAGEG
jgi:hypothetical protein